MKFFRLMKGINEKGGKLFCPSFLLIYLLGAIILASNPAYSANNKIEEYLDSAEFYAEKNKWNLAEDYTIKAIQLNPASKSNWLLWANIGEYRGNREEFDGALEAYNIGLGLQPTSLRMLSGRASIYLLKHQEEEALDDLNKVLENDSTLEWPRMVRGIVRLEKGDKEGAESDFLFLTGHYPENSQGFSGLGNLMEMKGETKKAIEYYTTSLNLQPDAELYFRKGYLQANADQIQEASATVREGLKKFPRNGNLYLLRASLHLLSYQNGEAEAALKLAKEYGADPQLIEKYFPNSNKKKRGK